MNEKNRIPGIGDVSRELGEILGHTRSTLGTALGGLQKIVSDATDKPKEIIESGKSFADEFASSATEKPKELYESGRNHVEQFATLARGIGATAFSKFVRDPRKSKELGDRLPRNDE